MMILRNWYSDPQTHTNQGFSLGSALRHSPKIVPDVREFADQFGQFVRDDFGSAHFEVMHSNSIVFIKPSLIGQISVRARLVRFILPLKYLFTKANQS